MCECEVNNASICCRIPVVLRVLLTVPAILPVVPVVEALDISETSDRMFESCVDGSNIDSLRLLLSVVVSRGLLCVTNVDIPWPTFLIGETMALVVLAVAR